MVNKLTKEQEAKFPLYVKKWTDIGLSTEPANREKAEKAINDCYLYAGLEPPKKIVWCGSPFSQGLTRAICLNKKTTKDAIGKAIAVAVGDPVRPVMDSVGDSVRKSVRNSVWNSVRNSVANSVGDSVSDPVRDSVWIYARNSVANSVGDSVSDPVWDAVGDSVWNSVRDSVRDSVSDSVWDAVEDAVWISVWNSVAEAVRDSVRDSVWNSVRNSVANSVRDSVGDLVWNAVGDAVWSVRDSVCEAIGDSVWSAVMHSVMDSVDDSFIETVSVSVRNSFSDSAGDFVWRAVGDSVGDSVRKSVRNSVWNSVRNSVRDSVGNSVVDSVGDLVWRAVANSVRDSLWDAFRDSVGDAVEDSGYGQHDASWLAFYDFFRNELNLTDQTEKLNGLTELAKNAGWFLPHKNICWVSERHCLLNRDENGRLHSLSQPAVLYPDGWAIYAVHGVRVPDYVIISPDKITIQQIENEQNAEVKRVMIDQYGQQKYLLDSGAVLINKDKFGELYKKDITADEPLVMVKVKNSTAEPDGTFKDYFLRVPPGCQTAEEAVGWTFGFENGTYNPVIET